MPPYSYSRYRSNAQKRTGLIRCTVFAAALLCVGIAQTPEPPRGKQYELTQKETQCLAHNVYYESRGEPIEGQAAVLQTTLNRAFHVKQPRDVCSVVYERNHKTCQFSWTCKPQKPVNQQQYKQTHDFVTDYVNGRFPHWQDKYATTHYFHADYINPRWKHTVVTKTGKHIFYEQNKRN